MFEFVSICHFGMGEMQGDIQIGMRTDFFNTGSSELQEVRVQNSESSQFGKVLEARR